ncbi:MAG TPA: glycosyltransferase family 9 protein [Bacteroidota bacterium]|nr:glycosyltransferase family 9 protein [Bacteroidota bacterium]
MPRPVERILVIKLRAIGDVLLSTAVLPGLRAAYPGASLDFLTEKYCAGVIEGNPHVSGLLTFDPRAERSLNLIRRVRAAGYDLVLDLFGNPRSAVLALLSGAHVRVGYRFNWRTLCYNRVVTPRGGTVHNVDFNLDALSRIGIDARDGKPFFPLDREAEAFAGECLDGAGYGGKKVVALNPGGGWSSKKWRPDQFAGLGRRIVAERRSGVLIVWGPGEEEDARRVLAGIGRGAVLAPPTTLKRLGALLKLCEALVTNDSGPMHIAAALGVPVLAIFGPTVPALQGPVFTRSEIVQNLTLDCLGCSYTECPIGNPCMIDLPVEKVYSSLERLMKNPTHVPSRDE